MIVDDFDVDRACVRPSKADPVLIVDPDRMLARPIAFEGFESISGWAYATCLDDLRCLDV